MQPNVNALNWFEIPAIDINRASKFYEAIFEMKMHSLNMMGTEMSFFPMDPQSGKVSGAICKSDMHTPSNDGCIIYLNGNPDLQTVLDKIEAAGGQVVMPKTVITEEIGCMAFFIDTEGNKIGLHSDR